MNHPALPARHLGDPRVARAAMDYLITLDAKAARMSTISYGEKLPVRRELTEACHLDKRRARFVESGPWPVL